MRREHRAARREAARRLQSPELLHEPRGRPTHRGVRHAAGEGHPTLLTAVAGTAAVEVDVEVPVFRPICPAALVLGSQNPRAVRGSGSEPGL